MMKLFTLAFSFLLLAHSAVGQIENRTETNCAGEMRSIYQVGDEGKPLIIAAKGLDCSICMSQAANVGNFAQTYDGQIEVWGAMTYLYNQSDPTCPAVADWESEYDWTNIFTFLDLPQFWMTGGGLPDYHVIHPETHELVYTGPSWNSASSAALELLTSDVADEEDTIQELRVAADQSSLKVWIDSHAGGEIQIEIVSLIGQKVAEFQQPIAVGSAILEFPFVGKEGVYLMRAIHNGETSVRRFVVTN